MSTSSRRDITLDLACGILIIRMVLKHALQWAQVTHYDFYEWMNIFFFIMPWFFFKSGMFFKSKPAQIVASTGLKHLIVPLLTMTFVGHLIICVNDIIEGGHPMTDYWLKPLYEIICFGSTEGNLALWFLLSLFGVRILYNMFSADLNPISILFLTMIGSLAIFHFHLVIPYYLGSTMAGLFFFTMGNMLKDRQYNKWVWTASFLVYLIHMFFIPSFVDMRSGTLLEGYYEVWMIGSVAGCITLNGACRWGIIFAKRMAERYHQIRMLSFIPRSIMAIGESSLIIYLFHWIFLMSFSLLLYDLPYFNGKHRWEYFTLSCIFTVVGLFVVYQYRNSKVIKFLTR